MGPGMFDGLGRAIVVAMIFCFGLGGLAFFALAKLFGYFGHHLAIHWK